MKPVEELIRAKRDGEALGALDLRALVAGVADGSVGDAQLGAFLMAVCLNGMDAPEQAALTLAMRDSGTVLDWPGLDGPLLDKHSTGGVGDLVSLVLAPALAACGGYVPMISGRGLGHTGGTLDKLESIPGFQVDPGLQRLRAIVREAGLAMVGQGPELAPADHRMYMVRDVTATVPSIPLITASILSKKLAEGLDALVLDVKSGSGAFLTDPAHALELATNLVRVAHDAGLPATALVTDMHEPLARSAGNVLELREALDWLGGAEPDPRLAEVTLALGAELLVLGRLAADASAARARLLAALASGAAAERFAKMVRLQGGPTDLLDAPARYLPAAPVVVPVPALRPGHVAAMDTRAIGERVVDLGGGRRRLGDTIDPRVGFAAFCRLGDAVDAGQPLALVHAADTDSAARAVAGLQAAIRLEDDAPMVPAVLLGRVPD